MSASDSRHVKARVIVSIALVVVLTAAGLGVFKLLYSMRKPPALGGVGKPRVAVRVKAAVREPYQETLDGYGLARAFRESDVSAEVTGVVTWVSPRLEAGARVEEGEELIRLDSRDYRQAELAAKARLDQARSAVARLEIDIESTGKRLAIAREDRDVSVRELQRVRNLVETGVETKSALDRQQITTSLREKEVLTLDAQVATAKKELERARAEVSSAEAAMERARLDLGRTSISAPYAGGIEERAVSLGVRVAPGTRLFSIVDLSRVEVPVTLAAARFGEVEVGAAARIRLREGGPVVWSGRVDRVSPTVNEKERTFVAYLAVEAEGGKAPIAPGAFVVAEIEGLTHRDVIPLPRIAFVGDAVYVVVKEAGGEAIVAERRPEVVRILPEVALVSSGIEPGEKVILTNLEQIADGARVLLVRSGAPAAPGRSPEDENR